jgi:Lar family restriction alleviation protein
MSSSLLPCPFCGGVDVAPSSHNNGHCDLFYLRCATCETEGPASALGGAKKAIERWNQRAARAALSSPVETAPIVPEGWRDILRDPDAVHVNMLRGTIAKPSLTQFLHAIGDGALEAFCQVVEIAWRNEASPAVEKACAMLAGALPPEVADG